ncbi:hypothetical protein [Bacillus cereus group sp. BfR-BA-01328]|uniref:hypothetical protein n=1 Tax=Bacillus cereus group sp. BfR-BA-01328 TaxID=2920304 RepID=UPI001F5723BD
MEKSKYKKHINVSLQNKKYYDAINPILLRWANNNENMSERVSESILTATRLESSIGINKLMNTFEMIEKTLQFYFPDKNREYHNAVEKAFEKIVTVNGTMLSEFLTNPVQFSEVQSQTSQEEKEEFVTSPPSSQVTENESKKETIPVDIKPEEPIQETEEIDTTIVKQEVIQKEEVSPTQEKEDKKKDLEITKSEKNTIPSEKESVEEIPEEVDEVVEDTKTSKDETKETEENQEEAGEISEANLGLFTL